MVKKHEKKNEGFWWTLFVLGSTIIGLIGVATVIIWVDPFFHYHKPVDFLYYDFGDYKTERYIGDGIVRNFDYDAIITGTSMVENFKTSDFEKIFSLRAVKVPYSGGYYKEINELIQRAYISDNDIKIVIRSLDLAYLTLDKDKEYQDMYRVPEYLTNNNWIDDINYVCNKTAFVKALYAINYADEAGQKKHGTTSFDEYANWNQQYSFGENVVLGTYSLGEPVKEEKILSEDEKACILENLRQNVTSTARQHSDTEFYFFIPPYSICYWDKQNNIGGIDYIMQVQKIMIEELLQYPNIKLFSFFNNYEMICNLDNYKDFAHYGEWINADILKWMKNGEYQLREDNYEQYLNEIGMFYNNYDYSKFQKNRKK